ncbi:MAG: hypothetical protein N3C61_02640, partial [Candidatus Micrarchaeota archaeon]|nr:hypothetical protein [Candidatus Micrarchaeota archaeon]
VLAKLLDSDLYLDTSILSFMGLEIIDRDSKIKIIEEYQKLRSLRSAEELFQGDFSNYLTNLFTTHPEIRQVLDDLKRGAHMKFKIRTEDHNGEKTYLVEFGNGVTIRLGNDEFPEFVVKFLIPMMAMKRIEHRQDFIPLESLRPRP